MKKANNILFIDDDSDDQHLFKCALEEVDESIRLQTAGNGVDAFELLYNEILPDVIVLDLNMPKMTGRDFLHYIKQRPILCDIPVIILSTSSNPKDTEETMELGAVGFITKPSQYNDLCSYVKTISNMDWDGL